MPHHLSRVPDEYQLHNYSHKHPLILKTQYNRLPAISCEACGDLVLGPYYSCNKCSNEFNLHKSCAKLPKEIPQHHLHSEHPLTLVTERKLIEKTAKLKQVFQHTLHSKHPLRELQSSSQRGFVTFECHACRERINGFSYSCRPCEFDLHVKCAFNFRNTDSIHHFIHNHVLTLSTEKGPQLFCTGCLGQILGPRYICKIPYAREGSCTSIVLHQSCAKLDPQIQHPMHKQHPLILILNKAQESHCDACDKDCSRRFTYSCEQCDFNLDLKCILEKGFKHFSHEHPLMFKELKESAQSVICDGCQDLILGPRYTCINTYQGRKCCFNFHKSCADLARKMQHPMHQQHPLILNLNGARESYCDICDKDCSRIFTYNCVQCDVNLDLKCILEKGFKHFSHEHPLVFKDLKESAPSVICDGCQDPVLGPRYTCINSYQGCKCCFNLHKSCADLPREMQHLIHRQHPLILTLNGARESYCDVCDKDCSRRFTYSCVQCDFNLDLKCFPEKGFKHFSHEHPLVFKELDDSAPSVICDGCQDPVLGPRYTCINTYQGRKCCFNLHKSCADLPSEMQHPMHQQHPLILNLNGARESYCDVCDKDCSRRFTYSCVQCDFNLDLKCFPEKGFKHFSHEHPLVIKELEESAPSVICDGCQDPVLGPRYTCINTYQGHKCCFNLHKSCADLASKMQHPMHQQHPLILHLNGARESHCDICEKDCSRRFTYSCVECDFKLDLKCFPEKGFKHFSHEHSLVFKELEESASSVICDGCQDPVLGPRFTPRDAALDAPAHPLILNLNGARESHCDICDKDCSRRFTYSCVECDFNLDLKCFPEKGFKHFSHEHSLVFKELEESVPSVICDGCQDPVLGPRYTCINSYQGCKCCFNLHKSCADLRHEMQYPMHQQHPLILNLNGARESHCDVCDKDCSRRFTYSCVECDFNLDLKCISEKGFKHFSHEHPLVFKELEESVPSVICDGCQDPVLGPMYTCINIYQGHKCCFNLHKSCADLPSEIQHPMHQQHPLILHLNGAGNSYCDVCDKDCSHRFTYSCVQCDFNLDLKCFPEKGFEHFSHEHPLVFKELEESAPSVICDGCQDPVLGPRYTCINTYQGRKCCFNIHKSCADLPHEMQHPMHLQHPLILNLNGARASYCDVCDKDCNRRFTYSCVQCDFNLDLKCIPEKGFKHFSHEHPLVFKELEESAPSVICDGCQDPVLGPRYICINTYQGRKCCFNLHKSCADLPSEMQHPMHQQHPLILNLNGARESHCDACYKDCSCRFTYGCDQCDFYLDLNCAFEKGFVHFSHEHPLMFKKLGDNKTEFAPLVICDGCQDPILGSSYTCINTYRSRKCCFNLHKLCADLPREIPHPVHRQHPLSLLNTIQDIKVRCSCNACNQPCMYRYSCSICDFNLHLNCASNWRDIIDTESHEHQFKVISRKEMAQPCDVCGEYWSGAAYYFCSICQLWVHKECASFPRDTKISGHEHRLKLTWFLEDIYPKDQVCKICSTNIDTYRTVYYCQECCGYVAHTTCVDVEYFQKEENKDRTVNIYEIDDAGEIEHFSHQHRLVANDHRQEVKDERILTCQGCIRPITEHFYSCTKQEEESCHFYLHKTCALLPERTLLRVLHQHQLILLARAPSIDGVFQCSICGMFHQGLVYSCEDQCALPTGEKPFYLDLECSIYWENRDLKHESHAHRLLLEKNWEDVCCRGCGSKIFFLFSCKRCNFHICIACVGLPLTARHRYDTHPLKLTYESIEDELGEYYCEICEGKRDPAHWFYWCKECEFDCHPHCIIGRYPRVQLGSTYKHESHVQHPVTLVSKWKSPIRGDKRDNILPCEKCGELCQGLVFECGECNINFHRDGCCGTIAAESSRRSPQIKELS